MTAISPTAQSLSLGRFDEDSLCRWGVRLAEAVEPPLVLYLQGDLGAGKTTLCRALVQALGHTGRVKSPTYGLLEHYPLERCDVLHLDLYRIGDPGELEYLGITDLFDQNTVLIVEWPERGEGALPHADLVIALEHAGDERFVFLRACSDKGTSVLRKLTHQSSS